MSSFFGLILPDHYKELKPYLPQALFEKLVDAVEKRNFIAHRFWFLKSPLMSNKDNLMQLIIELNDYAIYFEELDKEFQAYKKPKLIEIGLTEEELSITKERLLSGEISPEIPMKRKFKSKEKLIRVWKKKDLAEKTTILFETDDKELWQFCEVGLGWSYFSELDSTWEIFEELAPYLPAEINPRPRIEEPWNYSFKLKKGVELLIRPGDDKFDLRWYIKRA